MQPLQLLVQVVHGRDLHVDRQCGLLRLLAEVGMVQCLGVELAYSPLSLVVEDRGVGRVVVAVERVGLGLEVEIVVG